MFKLLKFVNPSMFQMNFSMRPKHTRKKILYSIFQNPQSKVGIVFLKSCSKPNTKFITLSYPINLSLFNEEYQWCVTLASQFLGLDTNGYIMEPLLSLLFVLDTCLVEPELPG